MKTSALLALASGVCLIGARASLAVDDQRGAAPPPEHAAQGRGIYRQFCSNCHGVNMVNSGTSSYDLRKFPRDDRDRFFTSVIHGKNSMPAWGDMLQPDEIEALWAYVRTGGKP